MVIDTLKASELINKIDRGEPVNIAFFYPDQNVMRALNSLFTKLLAKMDLIYLLDTLVTIQREIIINAAKANAKRLYFKESKLDITDPAQYEAGMADFRSKIIGDLEKARDGLAKSEYKIKIRLIKVPVGVSITVSNNVPILPEELQRINMRMEKARGYNDFSEAYDEVYDSTEGAGLGIVLVTLLLKNSGIGVDSYIISSDGDTTRCDLTIPSEIKPLEITTNIKKQILAQVEGLPTFPKHIIELQRLCGDPDSSITGNIQARHAGPLAHLGRSQAFQLRGVYNVKADRERSRGGHDHRPEKPQRDSYGLKRAADTGPALLEVRADMEPLQQNRLLRAYTGDEIPPAENNGRRVPDRSPA